MTEFFGFGFAAIAVSNQYLLAIDQEVVQIGFMDGLECLFFETWGFELDVGVVLLVVQFESDLLNVLGVLVEELSDFLFVGRQGKCA